MRIPYGRVQGSGYNACTGKDCGICPGGKKKKKKKKYDLAREALAAFKRNINKKNCIDKLYYPLAITITQNIGVIYPKPYAKRL
jgi:hypothetical protein